MVGVRLRISLLLPITFYFKEYVYVTPLMKYEEIESKVTLFLHLQNCYIQFSAQLTTHVMSLD